jgi:hypothetical protein
MTAELKKWGEVVRAAHIQADWHGRMTMPASTRRHAKNPKPGIEG